MSVQVYHPPINPVVGDIDQQGGRQKKPQSTEEPNKPKRVLCNLTFRLYHTWDLSRWMGFASFSPAFFFYSIFPRDTGKNFVHYKQGQAAFFFFPQLQVHTSPLQTGRPFLNLKETEAIANRFASVYRMKRCLRVLRLWIASLKEPVFYF